MSSGAVQAARPAISLDGVTKYFFQSGKRFPAIESITLDVAEGAFVSLVGPSGSGKSTVFNCIAGFVTPEVGSVTYRGERVTRPNIGIGYMTQKDTLLPWRSVLSNVMLPLRLKNVSQASPATARWPCSGGSGWSGSPTTGRGRSRAECRSAPPSPARWSTTPTRC